LTVDPPVPGTVEVQTLQWLEVCSVSDRVMVEQLQNTAQLNPGESEAIALALEINADLLLIDERRGRTEANHLGIRITLSRSMQAVSLQVVSYYSDLSYYTIRPNQYLYGYYSL
jgi:hypothetical protein